MATHFRILAWKIPRTEEPGGLQSTGSQSQASLSELTQQNTYIQRRKSVYTYTHVYISINTHKYVYIVYIVHVRIYQDYGKESTCNPGEAGWIPGSGRSPREGNGNPLQYSCLENPTDRGAWRATVRRVEKSN